MDRGDPGRLVERLRTAVAARDRLIVGLSSGTSSDGVDAALLRVSGSGGTLDVDLLAFTCVPYEPAVRARIAGAAAAGVPELARLHFELGEVFARAAALLVTRSGHALGDVDLIGSHGQTVFHEPPSEGRTGVTLQIGEADVIAARTGVTTVSDFRTADVAAGGSGAPLIPLVDWLLFRRPGDARLLLNMGGIANVTYVPDALEDVVAFDTGPGNVLLDEIVAAATGGRESFDEEGGRALRGRVDEGAVERFLARPYFSAPPPKSTGRELFGAGAARELAAMVHPDRRMESLEGSELDDLLATAAAVTARSVRDAAGFVPPISSVFASGGGVHNSAVMSGLSRLFSPIPVMSVSELGMDPDAKEAVGFAVLANETLHGSPGNLEAATGASRRVVLGKISPAL